MRRLAMKTVAWITNPKNAWNRLLCFVALVEQSMDRDVVTPLYRRLDALEQEAEELRARLACATAPDAGRTAS
jgi:hypothetical protein